MEVKVFGDENDMRYENSEWTLLLVCRLRLACVYTSGLNKRVFGVRSVFRQFQVEDISLEKK